ncbi:hypothetical protein [Nitrobacter sp. Nb-311A]|uniref:hypothetical protein n=1 Tax=Nitrobacter sp. Nb-311A TaxID=314253 RepID=UPI003528CBF2
MNQTATALAMKVGCEVSTITRLAKGERSPSIDLAARIERATSGIVTIADLALVSASIPLKLECGRPNPRQDGVSIINAPCIPSSDSTAGHGPASSTHPIHETSGLPAGECGQGCGVDR